MAYEVAIQDDYDYFDVRYLLKYYQGTFQFYVYQSSIRSPTCLNHSRDAFDLNSFRRPKHTSR